MTSDPRNTTSLAAERLSSADDPGTSLDAYLKKYVALDVCQLT